jgi:hypothetical protein
VDAEGWTPLGIAIRYDIKSCMRELILAVQPSAPDGEDNRHDAAGAAAGSGSAEHRSVNARRPTGAGIEDDDEDSTPQYVAVAALLFGPRSFGPLQ